MAHKLNSSRLIASNLFTTLLCLSGLLLCLSGVAELSAQSSSQYALLRKPTVSETQIAFSYGGDLWIVDRSGGEAKRLTSDAGPEVKPVNVGLLGADYSIDHDRYRFAKVYFGENWNPGLRAPLTEPGVNVHEGEYLLAVDGREVHGTDEVYSFFLERAGKAVQLNVGPDPTGKNRAP